MSTQSIIPFNPVSFKLTGPTSLKMYHSATDLANKSLRTSNPLGNIDAIAINTEVDQATRELATEMVNNVLDNVEALQDHKPCPECDNPTIVRATQQYPFNQERVASAYHDCPSCGLMWDEEEVISADLSTGKKLLASILNIAKARAASV